MRMKTLLTVAVLAALSTGSRPASGQYYGPQNYGPQMGVAPQGAMAPQQAGFMAQQAMHPMTMPAPVVSPYAGVTPASHLGDPGSGGGKGDCTSGCADAYCSCQGSSHRWGVFGEFLYLRARDAEVAYAVEVNSAVAPPTPAVQVGPVGVVDMDEQPGFRGGFFFNLDDFSSVTFQYTMFEADTFDRTERTSGILGSEVVGLVFHPTTADAADGGIFAQADYDISFDLIDVDYRELISYSCNHQVNFLVGARYANLEQQFNMLSSINADATVATDIDFEGAGLRLGLEGERYLGGGRFMVYAKGHASLIAGEFDAKYDQGNSFDASEVDTSWEAGRIVPILDLEVGGGWISACGNWRISGGYVYSAWYNTVQTDEWIDAVQANNFTGLGQQNQMTFDGFVARVETRF